MNRVDLIGRLTKDPEIRYIPGSGTATTTVTIAVDDYDYKEKKKTAQFIPVVIWGKAAENLAQYMSKGGMISVTGKIKIRTYEAKDGTKRYVTEVIADMNGGISYLSKPNFGDNGGQAGNQSYGNNNQNNNYNNQNNNYNNQSNNNNDYNNNSNPYSNNEGAAFGSENANVGENMNQDVSTMPDPFGDALGGFGGGFGDDFTIVDDGDMPF